MKALAVSMNRDKSSTSPFCSARASCPADPFPGEAEAGCEACGEKRTKGIHRHDRGKRGKCPSVKLENEVTDSTHMGIESIQFSNVHRLGGGPWIEIGSMVVFACTLHLELGLNMVEAWWRVPSWQLRHQTDANNTHTHTHTHTQQNNYKPDLCLPQACLTLPLLSSTSIGFEFLSIPSGLSSKF